MDIKQEISARLRELRAALGMTPTQLAKETGMEPQTIRDYEKGKSIPGGLFFHNLAKLGLNVEWLLIGSGWIDTTAEEFQKLRHIQQLTHGINRLQSDASKFYSNSQVGERLASDPGSENSIYIDRYVDVNGSCGPGQVVTEEAVVQVRVDAQLLRERVGNNFSRIKIAGVTGDSMEPTLSHGDQVLVDTSCDRFIDDAIYAIQQDGYLRFKRIKLRLDGSIVVKSDNEAENEPETYTAEQAQYFKVIGIVIPFKFGRFKV